MPCHSGLDRVELHVSTCSQQMTLIENTGSEPSLKKIASHPLGEILPPCVTAMRFANGSGQRILCRGDGDQMNMIGHKAPCDEGDVESQGFFFHEIEISKSIFVIREDVHRADTTLGYVVGVAWNNESSETGHAGTLLG
jgi:hypothetical protein